MNCIIYLFIISYIILILSLIIGFLKVKSYNNIQTKFTTEFSILIPFRNEAANLPLLLNSILKLAYPANLFEIIFIDDNSSDNSSEIILAFIHKFQFKNCSILKNSSTAKSPKKEAITLGINNSKFEWIITTDADCVLPKLWLKQYASYIINKKPYLVAGPVSFYKKKSFLNQFQYFNFLSLMGSTIGSFGLHKPILCNGANLAYNKAVFNELGGFNTNTNIASGDDVFLLEKIHQKHPKKTLFLKSKNVVVYTQTQPTLKAFVNQQIRWVSKSSASTNMLTKIVGIIVLFGNIALLITLLNSNLFYKVGLYYLTVKLLLDFVLIYLTAKFLKEKAPIVNYLLSSIIYPIFSLSVSLIAPFLKYNWKGRKFKQ